MNRITQDMQFRQSLMKYAEKYGVAKASRKYDKSASYIYFWRSRWDGSVESLRPKSRRPHHHPKQHTEEELKLIRDLRKRNPKLGVVTLWHRLRKRGYTRHVYSLYRVLHRLGMLSPAKEKKKYVAKPYEQMTHPGERIQIDVKVVPRRCIADPDLRLFQYTAIDEFTRLSFLGAYEEQSTYSSADFLRKAVAWYARHGIHVECVQTDNGFEFTNRFSNTNRDKRLTLKSPQSNQASGISSFVLIRPDITVKSNAATAKIKNASIVPTPFTRSTTLSGSSLPDKPAPTTYR